METVHPFHFSKFTHEMVEHKYIYLHSCPIGRVTQGQSPRTEIVLCSRSRKTWSFLLAPWAFYPRELCLFKRRTIASELPFMDLGIWLQCFITEMGWLTWGHICSCACFSWGCWFSLTGFEEKYIHKSRIWITSPKPVSTFDLHLM